MCKRTRCAILVALLLPPAPQPWRLIILTPPGETTAAAEQRPAEQATTEALAWWQARGQPVPRIGSVEIRAVALPEVIR